MVLCLFLEQSVCPSGPRVRVLGQSMMFLAWGLRYLQVLDSVKSTVASSSFIFYLKPFHINKCY